MAKVSYAKLDLKVCNDIHCINYTNSKGESLTIEVKSYLPIEEKMVMITKILNQSNDSNGYYNIMRVKIFTVLEVVYAYTNLNFTEKQKENSLKLYDSLVSSGLFNQIKELIPDDEWTEIEQTITVSMDNIYHYKNSIVGILDTVSSDYANLNLDATQIQAALADPNNLELLKSVLTNLG